MTLAADIDTESSGTVYVVDDEQGSRDALEALFRSVSMPVSAYASPQEFLEDIKGADHGCAVLDLRMPGMSGLDLQERMREADCHLPIIFLSGHGNISSAVRAMHGGAVDFMTKPVDDEALIEAVRKAISEHAARRTDRRQRETSRALMARLTRREREVMDAVVQGLSSKEIGRQLSISHRTVELHRSHIMDKLNARSVAELVQLRLAAQ